MKQICMTIFSLSLITQNLSAQSKDAAASNNSFGWSLFHEIQKDEAQDKNILFSPLSAWLALTLASTGSDGPTLDEFTQVLAQDNWSREYANQNVRMTLDSLLSQPDSGEKIKIGNAVWVNSDIFELSQTFADNTETYYSILPDEDPIRNEPFSDPATLERINDWVSKSTEGMIPSILNELSSDMASILLNALYFQGQWYIPFSPHATKDEPFYRAHDQGSTVKMMHERNSDFEYAENSQFKMLSLGFRSGTTKTGFPIQGRFALDLILPTKGALAELTQEDYESLLQDLARTDVIVGLPRFRFDFSKSLVAQLEALGLKKAFDPGQADFTPLGQAQQGNDLFISDVLQKTAAEMDENGFKAAAVTAVIISQTSAPIETQKPKEFIADHPFFFSLRDTETGLVLFQGLIRNPQN